MRKSWRRAIQPSVCALKLKQTCVVLCMQQNNNQKTQWCSFRASKVSSACLIKPKNRHKLNHTKIRQSPPLISDSAFIELLPCQLICAFSLHITAILLLQSTIVAVRCAYFSLTEKCIVVCVSEGVSVSCLQWMTAGKLRGQHLVSVNKLLFCDCKLMGEHHARQGAYGLLSLLWESISK